MRLVIFFHGSSQTFSICRASQGKGPKKMTHGGATKSEPVLPDNTVTVYRRFSSHCAPFVLIVLLNLTFRVGAYGG